MNLNWCRINRAGNPHDAGIFEPLVLFVSGEPILADLEGPFKETQLGDMLPEIKVSKDKLCSLYRRTRLSPAVIAGLFGTSKMSLYRALKRNNVPTRQQLRRYMAKIPERPRNLDDFRIVGLYDGDGYKASEYQIELTNADLSLITMFLKWFESLGISRNDFRFRIKTPDLANYFWRVNEVSRQLGVGKERFWKPSKLRGIRDTISAVYSNVYAAREFHKLRDNTHKSIAREEEAAAYLSGVFAADGCVYFDRKNRGTVQISYNSREERYLREVYEKCFKLLGVNHSVSEMGSNGKIRICYRADIARLLEAGLFGLSSYEGQVVTWLEGAKQDQVRKGDAVKVALNACLSLKSSGVAITSKNLSECIGRSRDWSSTLLHELSRAGLLSIQGKTSAGYVYEPKENSSSLTSIQ